MKKITIIAFLLLLPFFVISQSGYEKIAKVSNVLDVKTYQYPVVSSLIIDVKNIVTEFATSTNDDYELDEEYTERPFQGKEEILKITPYTGLTDHEEYNLKIKQIKPN